MIHFRILTFLSLSWMYQRRPRLDVFSDKAILWLQKSYMNYLYDAIRVFFEA